MASPPSTARHELWKAYLFLRTTHTAVTNTKVQIETRRNIIQGGSCMGNYNMLGAYEAVIREQQRDLEVWEDE